MTALFDDIIFGPINSRRLGISLGVNLLPQKAKICNFDCIYCECGSNSEREGERVQRRFAIRKNVEQALLNRLAQMVADGTPPDVITFAGNGEPTLHPEFEAIIEDTIAIRDRLAPAAKISVLSNATKLVSESVVRALKRVDNNILKLDSADSATAHRINRPTGSYSTEEVIELMGQFEGECIVQSMFLRGSIEGAPIDNTCTEDVEAWIQALKRINPRQVMIYSLDRDTPCNTLVKVGREDLEAIAAKVREAGFECSVA